jgi:pyrimidine-specific ribonucleoside hydrolase
VLRSGVKITQIGLDVTHKALVNEKVRRRIREVGGPVATVVADLMEFYSHKSRSKHLDGSPLHDPVAVAQVIQPGIVTTKPCFVDVEVHGELTSGRTVVDFWGATGREPNVDVGIDLDVDAFFDMIVEALRTYR